MFTYLVEEALPCPSSLILLLHPFSLDVILVGDPSGSRARWSQNTAYSTNPPSLGWELALKQI